MKVAFDTSVLVAGLIEPHRHHARALPWLRASLAGTLEAECTWHALAETWSVLTRLPIEPAISPPMAELAIQRLLGGIRPLEAKSRTYKAAIRRCTERGLRSGALFDALHLCSAELSGAEAFLTFDTDHFERLSAHATPRIIVPPDPPEVRLPAL